MSAYDVELDLGLDGDVELAYEETYDDRPHAGTPAERDDLRTALADALRHFEANTVPPGPTVRAWRDLAGLPHHEAGVTPTEARDDGIARAAAKWTEEEANAVDLAIVRCRNRALGNPPTPELAPGEFTTAEVWAELGPGFRVTKGIAGRMLAAKGAGIIANTGRTIVLDDDDTVGPNHRQRLSVWRAL